MTESSKPRIRRLAPKVRTGCATCKRRRVKCDETKPVCERCTKLGITCEGYAIPKAWIFEPKSSSSGSSSPESHHDIDNDSTNKSTSSESRPTEDVSCRSLTESPPPSPVTTLIPNDEQEGLVLMQSYVRLASACPVAWESDLYGARTPPAEMTHRDILKLHEQTPLTRVAHLAMATATLHLFSPDIYPAQLRYKYVMLAIAEVRARIGKRRFDLADLLHGISQIFLASVLSGDETAARAHLMAAKQLVDQQGGVDKAFPQTQHALRYGDFQLAIETVSHPVFLGKKGPDSTSGLRNFEFIDPTILKLSKDLCNSAEEESDLLSAPVVQCFRDFADCTLALSQAWSASAQNFDLSKLDWIAGNCIGIFNVLLTFRSSKNAIPQGIQEAARHTLILWIQLLCLLANNTVTRVEIRSNTTTLSTARLPQFASPLVLKGLRKWNHLVSSAKNDTRRGGDIDKQYNFWQLLEILREMEAEEPVRVWPLMARMWELKREYRGIILTPSHAVR